MAITAAAYVRVAGVMSIRTRIFGPGADDPLLPVKKPKGAQAESLQSVTVPRAECRRGNARGSDRYRLSEEQAILRQDGVDHVVELVNLSGGGAMIRCELPLTLWDHVGLILGEDDEIDCAVRWLKDDRVGLEFAHETRVDCDEETLDELLRAVIRKSFPDAGEIPLEYPKRRAADNPAVDPDDAQRRKASRHPLVWNGVIYYEDGHDYEAEPVRIRNISVTGALVQSGNPITEGAVVYLDLRAAGRHAATVKWTRGDQAGLEFHELFDIHSLSKTAPQVASANCEFESQEPWNPGWRRATVEQIAQSLSQPRT
jgi:PilZ domain